MLEIDFTHIVESSFGLTLGSLLAKLIERTCEQCAEKEPEKVMVITPVQHPPADTDTWQTMIPDEFTR